MKQTLKSLYKTAAIVMVTFLGMSSCTKEYYSQEGNKYYNGAQTAKEYFNAPPTVWEWVEEDQRYEYASEVKNLTDYVYTDGAIVGSVFTNPGTENESQENLPFIYTFLVDTTKPETSPTFTQTISCTFRPGMVYFYLQTSDRVRNDAQLVDLQFKVTMFWEEN